MGDAGDAVETDDGKGLIALSAASALIRVPLLSGLSGPCL